MGKVKSLVVLGKSLGLRVASVRLWILHWAAMRQSGRMSFFFFLKDVLRIWAAILAVSKSMGNTGNCWTNWLKFCATCKLAPIKNSATTMGEKTSRFFIIQAFNISPYCC